MIKAQSKVTNVNTKEDSVLKSCSITVFTVWLLNQDIFEIMPIVSYSY